jgi:hypothetical protein
LASAVAIQINDRKTGVAKTNTNILERLNTKTIRATMSLNRCHVHQQLLVDALF